MRYSRWLVPATFAIAAALGMARPASAQNPQPRARHVAHLHVEPGERAVREPPPPAPATVRPPQPFPGAVWTDGYYFWNGRAYNWIEGSWVRPVPGHRWSPWRWEQRDGSWVLIPGGWIVSHEGRLL